MRLLRFCQSFARNSAVGRLHLPRGATKHNFHHGNGGNSSNRRYFSGIAGAGGGAILSLSFFEKSKEQKTSVDAVDDNLMQIREADLYFEAALIDNAYNVLRRHRSSENPEILWRLARVLYKQGRATRNQEERKRLYYEAFDFAKKALENQPATGSFGANKWYAILLDRVGEMEGYKARIMRSPEVKAHFERALEINALDDPTTWHLLGQWHYELANLSSHERWIASLVFAKVPESSFDEALRCFERAETIRPDFYSANNYYLGLVYEKMKRPEEALAQFKKAFYAIVVDADDREIHEKALNHLRRHYKYDDEQLLREKPE